MQTQTQVSAKLGHGRSVVLTREQLNTVPTPPATPSWVPVPHAELVDSISGNLQKRGLSIVEQLFSVTPSGMAIFGVMKIATTLGNEANLALGFRAANNRRISIQIVAGISVFVCDNLSFRGDMIALKRKHTSGLDLNGEVSDAVDQYIVHSKMLASEIENLKTQEVNDQRAKNFIYDLFREEVMPGKFLPKVDRFYFEPIHKEFEPRNMWSLHNAFTEAAKDMPMTTRFDATQRIGKYFGMTGASR